MNAANISDCRRDLEWTPELVARFWDDHSNACGAQAQYFTQMVGGAIVLFLSDAMQLNGLEILDYGCGPGYLVDSLLGVGAKVAGADYSRESVRRANEKFAGRGGWEGAIQIDNGFIPVPDDSFDLVTCIETIEHMFVDARQKMLSEFRRALKPGGLVMMTTPNDEDLTRSSVFCPNCGHAFHRMQHMSSWNKASLSRLLTGSGFTVEFCEGIDLGRWGEPRRRVMDTPFLDVSLRDVLLDAQGLRCWFADRIRPRAFPYRRTFRRRMETKTPFHLVAVARKL